MNFIYFLFFLPLLGKWWKKNILWSLTVWVLIIGHVAPVMLQLGIFKKELRNICMFMELL